MSPLPTSARRQAARTTCSAVVRAMENTRTPAWRERSHLPHGRANRAIAKPPRCGLLLCALVIAAGAAPAARRSRTAPPPRVAKPRLESVAAAAGARRQRAAVAADGAAATRTEGCARGPARRGSHHHWAGGIYFFLSPRLRSDLSAMHSKARPSDSVLLGCGASVAPTTCRTHGTA